MSMQTYPAINEGSDGVITLQIGDDGQPHFDRAYLKRFRSAVARLHDIAGQSGAVVLLEGGARVFCAGASRDALLEGEPWRYYELARQLVDLPLPTIAAMCGHAVGGGLLVGLWCDFAFFAEESLYGANFPELGLTPGMGASVAVPRAFGAAVGADMLWTGRLVKGRDARAWGVPCAAHVMPRAEVRPAALALASRLLAVASHVRMQWLDYTRAKVRELLLPALRSERALQRALLRRSRDAVEASILWHHGGAARDNSRGGRIHVTN